MADAKAGLMKKFKFSDLQATAILEMRLQKLAGLERKKVLDELKEVQALIEDLKGILGSEQRVRTIIKTELSDIKAKVILVNFWATWCEACMVEMPSIVQLRNEYKDKGFEVVGVNLDENFEAVVPKATKELGITFPVFSDVEGKITDYFDVHAIPLTVILGAGRKILFIENGDRNWNDQDIHHQLEQWLETAK